MSRIGPCGVHRGVRSGSRTAGRPDFSEDPLDTGIRPASNPCWGDPGDVADGEVNAHLEIPDHGEAWWPSSERARLLPNRAPDPSKGASDGDAQRPRGGDGPGSGDDDRTRGPRVG